MKEAIFASSSTISTRKGLPLPFYFYNHWLDVVYRNHIEIPISSQVKCAKNINILSSSVYKKIRIKLAFPFLF